MWPGSPGSVRTARRTAVWSPPENVRQLRDLPRTRNAITNERSREVQRLEKNLLLEYFRIKLSSIATDITGVRQGNAKGRQRPAGCPDVQANVVTKGKRRKIPALTEALTDWPLQRPPFVHGRVVFLNRTDAHSKDIAAQDVRIGELMHPLSAARELLAAVPGVSSRTAGADMSVFPTSGHLTLCVKGRRRIRGQRIRRAGQVDEDQAREPLPETIIGHNRRPLPRSQTTYPRAKCRRIKSRRGPIKALVAVEHSIFISIGHMLKTGEC